MSNLEVVAWVIMSSQGKDSSPMYWHQGVPGTTGEWGDLEGATIFATDEALTILKQYRGHVSILRARVTEYKAENTREHPAFHEVHESACSVAAR